MSTSFTHLILENEDRTRQLAQRFAEHSQQGTVYLLSGPIGAGKTFFARAFIRAWVNSNEDVPSPTFTLVQTYEDPKGDIWHCDLYRLTSVDDVMELGLEEAFETSICLVEWPDRLGSAAPENAIRLAFEAETDGSHSVGISGPAPLDFLENLEDG